MIASASDMLTQAEMRRLANAVRQVIVSEEGGTRDYANAISKHDTLADFKALHRKLSER